MSTEGSTLLTNSGIGQLMAILAGHLKLMESKDAAVEKELLTAATASSLFAAKQKALENEKALLLSIMNDIDEMNTFLKNIILIENLFNKEYQPFKQKQEAARKRYASNISKYENKPKVCCEAGSFVELIFAGNTHLSSFETWLDKVCKTCDKQNIKIKSFSGAMCKKMERAFYKAFYGYYDKDGFKQMTDILRCSFVFDTFDDLYQCFSVIELLAEQTLGGILRVKDRYNPTSVECGYRDLLINIYCPQSKIVAEIQLHFINFYKYKKISHSAYKRVRLFQRDEVNLAYEYSSKFLRPKIGSFEVYKVSEDETVDDAHDDNKDNMDVCSNKMTYEELLKEWDLLKYKNAMKEEGWDDPTDWAEIEDQDLKELGFGKGHIKRFKRKYKEWMEAKQNESKEEKSNFKEKESKQEECEEEKQEQVRLTEFVIGTMNYAQCVKKCQAMGGYLATKKQILKHLGGGIGGDIWTPVSSVSDSGNDWLQIGGGCWPYGQLHTEIKNGYHGKPAWGTQCRILPFKQKLYCANATSDGSSGGSSGVELTQHVIGTMTYEQCVKKCESMGGQLATKQQILNYLGSGVGGDSWSPVTGVSKSGNDWLQIGGGNWPYGKLHTEIANGVHGKPSWGTKSGTHSFKQTFYCVKGRLTEHTIGTMSYEQCVKKCQTMGGQLATKQQILNYLKGGVGGDSWTPVSGVSDSGNDWLQIGGGNWPYGKLHTEIANGVHGKPSWGTKSGTHSFKQTFYCVKGRLTEHTIGTMSYEQCVKKCQTMGGQLATKQHSWPYGKLHTEIANGVHGKPSWGTKSGTYGFKQKFYCFGAK
eukprot:110513_1